MKTGNAFRNGRRWQCLPWLLPGRHGKGIVDLGWLRHDRLMGYSAVSIAHGLSVPFKRMTTSAQLQGCAGRMQAATIRRRLLGLSADEAGR
jgi:hypothetical protein